MVPQRIIRGCVILTVILLVGTGGYMLFEHWDFMDALYMTVITITTVGYREVGPVSGTGRIFTIFIIFFGVGIIAYILGLAAQVMVDTQVRSLLGRRKLGRKLKSLKGHYILCGFGRIGSIITRELWESKIPMVVIDTDPDNMEGLESEGIPYINDDATSDEVLLNAGIERAKGVVSVVASDADNLFITMTARGLNPGLFILARADGEATEKKLLRAGANRVMMPYLIGGHKMAQAIIKPAVTDFLDVTFQSKDIGLEMEEVRVGENSRLNGLALMDSGIRQELDVIIVAIRKKDGEMQFNPSSQTRIEAGDTLISLGKRDDLAKLENNLSG
ncbi:MAG: potassium channel protein [Deltaproteobacteria bacterium]|nr:potassium channel protein [Deltaproteobacteria bacterium]